MKLSGADIVIKTLIEQGCDVVFGYPGGQIINIYDSLYKYQDEIKHVLTAHEQEIFTDNYNLIYRFIVNFTGCL